MGDASTGAAEPGKQGVHEGAPVAPSVEVPGRHAEQVADAAVEVWPIEHSLQLLAASLENLPGQRGYSYSISNWLLPNLWKYI